MAKTVKERLQQLDQILEQYESSQGLPNIQAPGEDDELQHYLSMTREEIEGLGPTDCAEISIRLNQFGFHLQRLYNREQARVEWAKSNLNKAVSKEYQNFGNIYNHDIKVATIVEQNEYAKSLYDIVTYATQRSKRLQFLANSLNNLGKVFMANQKAKSMKD